MNVLFLTSGDRVPSTRFRILPYLEPLRRAGIRATVRHSFPQKYEYFPKLGFRPSQMLKRLVRWWHFIAARVRRYDAVFIEREMFDSPDFQMERRFRQIAPRLILDVDDAIFLRYPEKVEALARMADTVIAANPLLADVLARWNDHIVIIPTGVQLSAYPLKDDSPVEGTVPIIGWIGTTGNLQFFAVVAEALRNLAMREAFELRLIVSDISPLQNFDLSGVNIRQVVWNPATEIDELRKFDIGIMPLTDDSEWSRFKCPTKLLQYMSIGIPGVASPVGFTGTVVQSGVNGMLAATPAEWEACLSELINNRETRLRLGRAGRRTVESTYCVEVCQSLLVETILGTVR